MLNSKRRKIIQIIPCDPKLQASYMDRSRGCPDVTYKKVACLALIEDPDKIQDVVPMIYTQGHVEFADELPNFASVHT